MFKKIFLISIIIFLVACEKQDYSSIYSKRSLTVEDCKNTDLAAWILFDETGLDLRNKKINIIETNYYAGIPLQIEQLPIYYKVEIDNEDFLKYKKQFFLPADFSGWSSNASDESLDYVFINQFELYCSIKKDYIIFGFRNVDIIAP